jgi:hypothetical protein
LSRPRDLGRAIPACSALAPRVLVVARMDHPLPPFTFAPSPPAPPSPMRALLHRWFVTYNPTYLASAALVLAGLTLVSCDLAATDADAGVGLTAVAELYALSLIGGAWLLRRLGQRRVAVMVGLLAALYQCDLTMHTETCAFLEHGWVLALAWAALFHLKLRLLARALELTPSASALAVPSLGALGLALLPYALRSIAPHDRGALVAALVLAIGMLGLFTTRRIDSAVGYDVRGRRAIHGTWMLWAAAGLAHVTYWSVQLHADLVALAPATLLLATRWAARERTVWGLSAAALGLALAIGDAVVPVTALMIAMTLALRALRTPVVDDATEAESEARAPSPYRGAPSEVFEPTPETNLVAMAWPTFERAGIGAFHRLGAGGLASAHFAAWSALGAHGHVPWLDAALVVIVLATLARARRAEPLAALLPTTLHVAIAIGILRAPHGFAEWGVIAIGSGFAVLAGSLVTSWWLAGAPKRVLTGST